MHKDPRQSFISSEQLEEVFRYALHAAVLVVCIACPFVLINEPEIGHKQRLRLSCGAVAYIKIPFYLIKCFPCWELIKMALTIYTSCIAQGL